MSDAAKRNQGEVQAVSDGGTHQDSDRSAVETLLLICCPHCQMAVEMGAESSTADIRCSDCGQPFQVVGPHVGQWAPACVGRFELVKKLGEGSFGAVWRARDSKLDRDVAVKIPRRQNLGASVVEKVMREARAAARLCHRHIVTIHEVGRDGDAVFIVSDLIRGVTLDVWSRRHPLSFGSAAELCRVVAEALDHAHGAGVIHRDLKPANILIDEHDEPHLTDFGLARRVDEEVAIHMDGHMMGTPAYMSPEQARGKSHLCDRRSDVYSLGVILFQLLTNELPFRGNLSVLPHKVIHDDPPSPRRLNQYVPRDLATICLKCMEKDPAKRYQTAAALADELQRYCKDEPILARPVGPLDRLWRWSRRQPAVATLAASTLGLLLLIAGLSTWEYSRERALRKEIQETANSQKNLLLFIRNSDTVQRNWEAVERAARDPRFVNSFTSAVDDPELQVLRAQLDDDRFEKEWPQLRRRIIEHPARGELQKWVKDRYDASDPSKVFAWFVQDARGIQFARQPVGENNIGHNYAWRTYYHGGERDFTGLQQYLGEAAGQRLTQTHLSDDFRTEMTDEAVVAVSTPVVNGGRFLGVVGVFLYIEPPKTQAEPPKEL